jgi:hypothetical protein
MRNKYVIFGNINRREQVGNPVNEGIILKWIAKKYRMCTGHGSCTVFNCFRIRIKGGVL